MSTTFAPAPGARVAETAPAVRVRPVPRTEPATDDERRAAGLPAAPMTAPALPLRMPSQRRRSPDRRTPGTTPAGNAALAGSAAPFSAGAGPAALAGGPPASDGSAGPGDPGQPAAGGTVVSPARLATRRFLAICLEVLGGFRPMTQLRALCLPERFEEIAQRLRAHTPGSRPPGPPPDGRSAAPRPTGWGASPVQRPALTGAPPRPGRVGQSGTDRVSVRRVQVCDAVDGVAEVAAVLSRRDHVWAMALRLERRQERWFCAHLEVI